MACTRLLRCPEVLAQIFSHLELPAGPKDVEDIHAIEIGHKRRELRGTLAAASLSCRAFTELAQAVLWRRLDSVQPLLWLLSDSYPECAGSTITMLHAKITPESWLRLRTHARHVRVLHDKDWSAVHPSTWAFVARWCGPEPLLPNLEELSGLPISVRSPTTMMFISSKLRCLSVALKVDDNDYGRVQQLQGDPMAVYILFQQIVSMALGIRTLSIANHLSLSSSCFDPIEGLENIKELYAQDCVLDFSLLWWLGRRPIRSLAIRVDMTNLPPPPEDSDDEDEEYDPFEGCFRTLRHLTVRGAPEHIELFLNNTATYELETLAVEFLSGASQSIITQCIEDIAEDALLDEPVLRELTIKYPYESHYDDEHKSGNAGAHTLRDASLTDVIGPALSISFLRKVTLNFHQIPALADAGLLRMIDAWPQLTALHIPSPRERYGSRVALTPSILVEFARRCPHLAELTLPELSLYSLPTEKEMPFVGQRVLRRLRIGFRERGRQHVLYKGALFIDRLFPCLTLNPLFAQEEEEPLGHTLMRMSWENNVREEERTWRRMEEFLYAMQLGRRHRDEARSTPH